MLLLRQTRRAVQLRGDGSSQRRGVSEHGLPREWKGYVLLTTRGDPSGHQPGFLPLILGPVIIPKAYPRDSSARMVAMSRVRAARAARVVCPWRVFAAAQRALPSGEVGPLDWPP